MPLDARIYKLNTGRIFAYFFSNKERPHGAQNLLVAYDAVVHAVGALFAGYQMSTRQKQSLHARPLAFTTGYFRTQPIVFLFQLRFV